MRNSFALTGLLTLLFCTLPAWARQTNELTLKSQRAKQAMETGKFEEAVALYRDLVRVLPGEPRWLMNLGVALHSAGKYREAVTYLQQFLKKEPNAIPAHLLLGLAHLKLSEPDKAIGPLQRVVRAEPNNRVARLEFADALLSLDRFQEASEQFRLLTQLDSRFPKAWQGLGLSYASLSRRAFANLESTAPESAYWYFLLARSRLKEQRHGNAFFLFKQALQKNPALRGVHAGLAAVYRETGHPDWAAQEELKEQRIPQPDCTTVAYECDFVAGRYEKLLSDTQGRNSAEALYWRALVYGELALRAFVQLASLPPSAEIHELLAQSYRLQALHHLSIKEWQEALKFAPQDARLKRELARALWSNDNYQAAEPLLQELILRQPDSAELNFELGDTLLQLRKNEEALGYLEKAVALSPDLLAAQGSLGTAYGRLAQWEKAIPPLKTALKIDLEGSLHFQLGRAYQRLGQTALAEQMMSKSREISRSAESRRRKITEEYQITPP